MRKHLGILFFLVFATACGSTSKHAPSTGASSEEPSKALTSGPLPGLNDESSKVIVQEILEADAGLSLEESEITSSATPPATADGEAAASDTMDADQLAREIARRALAKRKAAGLSNPPDELNQRVGAWIHYFTVQDRERFERFLKNGERFRPTIERILEEEGVPRELYYLAMIESGFQNHARSWAKAVGMWQFMSATGSLYGLKVNPYVDYRRDPIRATQAAARHLKDLYQRFGSWHLALAAYNAGPGRVNSAIRRSGTRNFWLMVERRFLPPETRNYVPKFLAALTIGHHLDKFGFTQIASEPYPDLKPVHVPVRVRLGDVAKKAGVPLEALREVNPQLKKDMTPPKSSTGRMYRIWVPVAYADQVEAVSGTIPQRGAVLVERRPAQKVAKRGRHKSEQVAAAASGKKYKVRRGDNLSVIAKRFGTSVTEIKSMNGLGRSSIRAGQVLVVGRNEI